MKLIKIGLHRNAIDPTVYRLCINPNVLISILRIAIGSRYITLDREPFDTIFLNTNLWDKIQYETC